MLGSREMQRLRLEQAARSIEFEARVANEALAQFDQQQRFLDQAALAASKRRISELETSVVQAKSKKQKQHIHGKLDQKLSAFGFTGARREETAEVIFFCECGCDRGFSSIRARAAHHARAHKPPALTRSAFDFERKNVLRSEPSTNLLVKPERDVQADSKEADLSAEVGFVFFNVHRASQVMSDIPSASAEVA